MVETDSYNRIRDRHPTRLLEVGDRSLLQSC